MPLSHGQLARMGLTRAPCMPTMRLSLACSSGDAAAAESLLLQMAAHARSSQGAHALCDKGAMASLLRVLSNLQLHLFRFAFPVGQRARGGTSGQGKGNNNEGREKDEERVREELSSPGIPPLRPPPPPRPCRGASHQARWLSKLLCLALSCLSMLLTNSPRAASIRAYDAGELELSGVGALVVCE